MKNKEQNTTKGSKVEERYILKLYVAGTSNKSMLAYQNLKKICEENLEGKYEIILVDLLEKPKLGIDEQIIAVPTLIKQVPEPVRKIIGTLSDTENVLVGLDIKKVI